LAIAHAGGGVPRELTIFPLQEHFEPLLEMVFAVTSEALWQRISPVQKPTGGANDGPPFCGGVLLQEASPGVQDGPKGGAAVGEDEAKV